MDFTAILKLLPTILQAIDLAKQIGQAKNSGASVISLIQSKAPDVIDLVTRAGADLFPKLTEEKQAAAGATRFDPVVVKKVQTQLNKLGASPQLDVDGYYGRLTKAAVQSFQASNGLEADGWAGPLTQKALDKAAV